MGSDGVCVKRRLCHDDWAGMQKRVAVCVVVYSSVWVVSSLSFFSSLISSS